VSDTCGWERCHPAEIEEEDDLSHDRTSILIRAASAQKSARSLLLFSLMAPAPAAATTSSTAAKPRKRFVGSRAGPSSKALASSVISHQVPQDILQDVQLNNAIMALPSNYSFEIHKTIHHVRKNEATMVALQMPEGLQMFACTIADIIERCVPENKRSDERGATYCPES